jgi:two-component system chemotaxis sensor kinase CheA
MGIEVPDDEIDNKTLADIICNPGFSTTSSVTKLSGRGVGMDVVKTEVEKLGGFLTIETAKDKGTAFTLALPLTFALTDALHFKAKNMSYLMPIWGLVGTEKFDERNMRSFGGDEKLYNFRGKYLPIMNLSRVYGSEMSNINGQGKILIFLDTGRQEFGIIVDEVLDCRQIVVKSLESHYRNVKGISGATIMGDGSVALVLDLFDLEEIYFNKHSV